LCFRAWAGGTLMRYARALFGMNALSFDSEAFLAKSIPPPPFWTSLIASAGGPVVVSASGGGAGRATVSLTSIAGSADRNEGAAASAGEEPVGLG